MSIDGFDYKDLANNLTLQAANCLPENISCADKKYLLDTLSNNMLLTGKALDENPDLNFDASDALFVTQIVGEWTFHKTMDLVHSQIPNEYWDSIIQKVAFVVFEISKEGLKRNINPNDLINDVEYRINIEFENILQDLCDNGSITHDIKKHALSLSSIDDYAKKEAKKDEQKAAAQTLKVTQNSLVKENKFLKSAINIFNFFNKLKKHE